MILASVADPRHFGVDPDPDLEQRIHASEKWIRILDPAIFIINHFDANKKLF
jgi:hypothetical protein